MKDRVGTLPNVMIIHAGSSARRDDGIGKTDDGEVYARERGEEDDAKDLYEKDEGA